MNVLRLPLSIFVVFIWVQKYSVCEDEDIHFKAFFANFYGHHQRFKWTIWGNNGDENITCKLDIVSFNDKAEVHFKRQYNESGVWKEEELTGTFSNSSRAYMKVYEKGKHKETEQLVILDEKRVCGVVYTINIGKIPDGGSPLRSCEVRIRTDSHGPQSVGRYYQCDRLFRTYCGKKYDVYNPSCPVKAVLNANE